MHFINALNRTFLREDVTRPLYNWSSSMAKKQEIATKTAAVAPARAAKPKAPRVKAAQHSRAGSVEPVIAQTNENPREVIARIAYGYWESRGCRDGAALEDWVRAEQEYRQGLAVSLV
jgi:hypothetical protein